VTVDPTGFAANGLGRSELARSIEISRDEIMKLFAILATLVTMIMTLGSRGAVAEPLKVGQAAPDFNLPDQNGKTRKLSDYHGKWLTLYFYVKDDTPGCTKQACKFRDDIHQLRDLGAEVVGISVDDSASHASFAEKYNLPFPLLADSKGETARRYDSMWSIIGMAKRNTYLIDPEGRIAEIYLSASTSRNSAEVIEDLKRMKGS
jgi:thioredoxin-dependent peroxiredoxin